MNQNRPVEQRPPCNYTPVQQDSKAGATTHRVETAIDGIENDYKPFELRTSVLIAFCVVAMAIFVLIQMGAAAFMGATNLHALVARSIETQTPTPNPTGAPRPGSWTGGFGAPSFSSIGPEPTEPPTTAPGPSSFSNTDFDIGNVTVYNSALSSSASVWKSGYYFLGAYLPTLVAVILGVWWKCVYTRLKEMEPFYQMSKPGGANAKDSLLLAYPSASLFSVFVKSYTRKHWLSFLGSVNMALVTLCTLLASETLLLTSAGPTCGVIADSDETSNQGCSILLTMRPILGWILSVVLVIVLILTICMTRRLHRHASGIYKDPTTIAGAACLYSDNLAANFPGSLQNQSEKYVIDSDGIISMATVGRVPVDVRLPPHYQNQQTQSKGHKKYGHPSMHPAVLTAFLLFSTGLLFMILYYRFISKPETGNVLEDFMNSQSFGVRLFMTALGLLIKFYWGWVEDYIRCTRPYSALAMPRGAAAANSVLLSNPSHPFTALFYRSTWSHLLLATVTMMAVLSEVLVVTLSGVPFTTATIYLAFEVSVYVSIGILAAMVMTIGAVLLWTVKSRLRCELPKAPESLAEVFGLLNDTKGRKALRELYGGTVNDSAGHSHVSFRLRKKPENGTWCISEVDEVDDVVV
jgi:hypothetical protein